MSDRSQNSQKMIVSVAEDLTAVMNIAGVGKRSFTELANATDSKKPGSVTAKPKGAPKKNPGLRPVRQGQHGQRNGYPTPASDQQMVCTVK